VVWRRDRLTDWGVYFILPVMDYRFTSLVHQRTLVCDSDYYYDHEHVAIRPKCCRAWFACVEPPTYQGNIKRGCVYLCEICWPY
jgi:hypothetical protein